jgi:hypothetical protein
MKQILVILSAVALMSSCVVHTGTISTTSFEKPHKITDVAVGSVTIIKPLYLGGLSKDALIYEAKHMLQQYRPLSSNERYANTTLDLKKSYWLFGTSLKVTMISDVVRFDDVTTSPIQINEPRVDSILYLSDSVMLSNYQIARIINIGVASKRLTVFYLDKNSYSFSIKSVSPKKVYLCSSNKKIKTYMVGDRIEIVYDEYINSNVGKKAEVIALKNDFLLVRIEGKNKLEKLEYIQVKHIN